ncbi:MAG: GGDEF domain-containing protein [Patescibacteria group bacterium]
MPKNKVAIKIGDEELLKKIEELEQTVRTLKQDLIHDTLTGLKTRAFFEEEAGVRLNTMKEHPHTKRKPWFGSTHLAIILFDIDFFKKINDTYGHLTGDGVLKAICASIEKGVRKGDIVARWGGEEIVVALLGATEKLAIKKAGSIRKGIERLGFNNLPDMHITISGGVAAAEESDITLAELVRRADKALYKAKESGRNMVITYSELKDGNKRPRTA